MNATKINKILDILYKKLRDGNDTNSETDISFDDLINENYNYTDIRLAKNHICILREYFNNNEVFDEHIKYFRNFSDESILINWNTTCANCELGCSNNINLVFNFFAALFIMAIHIRSNLYDEKIKNELSVLFFKQFFLLDDNLNFNEDRMLKILIDYDLEIAEKNLLENDNLSNLKSLITIKDFLISMKNRYNNLSEEKLTEINIHIDWTNNKLEYFEKMYALEIKLQIAEANKPSEENKKLAPLKSIWLAAAKITIEEFIEIGIENHLWDKNYKLLSTRGKLYGTGKILLSSISVALKNFAISDQIHYEAAGEAFCKVFEIKINKDTNQPYKSFCNGNPKYIREFKRLYRI
jgi:hypothetical protein